MSGVRASCDDNELLDSETVICESQASSFLGPRRAQRCICCVCWRLGLAVDDELAGGEQLDASSGCQAEVDAVRACVDAGSSASTHPLTDALAICAALDGYATLRPAFPRFQWPTPAEFVDKILNDGRHIPATLAVAQPGAPAIQTRS